ncbi:MAG: sulfotransferase [Planctomycetes bacterium]|nr:sulfotransferase [Planctomycetota bacterium]
MLWRVKGTNRAREGTNRAAVAVRVRQVRHVESRLPADFLERYRSCGSFDAGYRLLRDLSCRCHKGRPLVDKTPRYMACLADVLRRAPGTPLVVAVRDPLELLVSWLHLGNSPGEALTSIRVATESLRAVVAEPRLAASVSMVSYTELRQDPGGTLASLQAWLGRWPLGLDLAGTSGVPATAGGLHRMPQDIEADGCDLLGRVPALELERLRRELVREVPAAASLSRGGMAIVEAWQTKVMAKSAWNSAGHAASGGWSRASVAARAGGSAAGCLRPCRKSGTTSSPSWASGRTRTAGIGAASGGRATARHPRPCPAERRLARGQDRPVLWPGGWRVTNTSFDRSSSARFSVRELRFVLRRRSIESMGS